MVVFFIIIRERVKWAWGKDGEREAEEGEEASDHLFQLPARRLAEEVSEHAVPGAAGESRACSLAGTHTNTGENLVFLKNIYIIT